MELPFDPAIPLLGLYPKNPETLIQKNLCTPMFIAAQLTIAKYWKQPKCPPGNKWIKSYGSFTQWILHSREKEGAPTLCDSMDGTGDSLGLQHAFKNASPHSAPKAATVWVGNVDVQGIHNHPSTGAI